MTYYLGKDVNVYWTTEHATVGVSGSFSVTTGSTLAAHTYQAADNAGLFVLSRSVGISGTSTVSSQIRDVTGLDFTPGAMNEDISYMGQNTNLSAKVKNDLSLTITKKKNDDVWDALYNDHGRDGVYVESGGTVVADSPLGGGAAVGFVHNGLTTSRMQNFGYRVYLVLKDGAEVTLELYSYVDPLLTNTESAVNAPSITGLTTMADI